MHQGFPPVDILALGKLKGDFQFLKPGIEWYLKRLQPYTKVALKEIADEPMGKSIPDTTVLDREAQRILPLMDTACLKIALWEGGEMLDSVAFAHKLNKRLSGGNPINGGICPGGRQPMIIVIGSACGLSPKVLDAADWVVSLSPMTFPHPMVRLIVLEQLYRAFKILKNEPYHK